MALQRPKAAEDVKELGNMAYELQEFDEALECYLDAISLDPSNPVFYINAAAVHFELQQWQDCADMCAQAVATAEVHPVHGSNDLLAKAFSRRGYALARLGQHSEAVAALTQALKRKDDPEWRQEVEQSLSKISQARANAGEPGAAALKGLAGVTGKPKHLMKRETAASAPELDPATVERILELFREADQLMASGQIEKTIDAYNEAERLTGKRAASSPLFEEHHLLYAMRALANLRANRIEDSLLDSETSIRLNALFPDAYLLRANILGLQERYRDAVETLVQAYTIGAAADAVLERLQTFLISLTLEENRLKGASARELQRLQVDYRVRLDNRGSNRDESLLHFDGTPIPRAGDLATQLVDDPKLEPHFARLQSGLSLPQVIMGVKKEAVGELVKISQIYLAGLFRGIGSDFDDSEFQSELRESRQRRRDLAKVVAEPLNRLDASPEQETKLAVESPPPASSAAEPAAQLSKTTKKPKPAVDEAVLAAAKLPVIDGQGGGVTPNYRWSQTPTDVTITWSSENLSRLLPAGVVPSGKQTQVDFEHERLRVTLCGVVLLNGELPHTVIDEEGLWTFDSGSLEVILQKVLHGIWWSSVLQTEPEVDVSPLLAEEARLARARQQYQKQQEEANRFSYQKLMKGWQDAESLEDFEEQLPPAKAAGEFQPNPQISKMERFAKAVVTQRRLLRKQATDGMSSKLDE